MNGGPQKKLAGSARACSVFLTLICGQGSPHAAGSSPRAPPRPPHRSAPSPRAVAPGPLSQSDPRPTRDPTAPSAMAMLTPDEAMANVERPLDETAALKAEATAYVAPLQPMSERISIHPWSLLLASNAQLRSISPEKCRRHGIDGDGAVHSLAGRMLSCGLRWA